MERENFINPELTGAGQNAYSSERGSNMPEGGSSPDINPSPNQADSESAAHIAQARRVAASPDASPALRAFATEWLASQGQALGGDPRAEGTRPVNQQVNQIGGLGGQVSPEVSSEAFAGEREDIPRNPGESEVEYQKRLFEIENPRAAKSTVDQQEIKLTPEQQVQFADRVRKIEDETPSTEILGWIVDPLKRDEYFNEIYALVDSRPYDFWNTAFDQINDGTYEHHFNQTLLLAAKGKWEQLSKNPRSNQSAFINLSEVKKALKAKYPKKYADIEVPDEDIEVLKNEIAADFDRFQRERQIRRTLHDVNAVLYLPTVKAEQLFENMQQFDSTSGDIALSMPGVREMMNVYESVIREIMAENDGWLPSEAMLGKSTTEIIGGKSLRRFEVSEAERRSKERFAKLAKAGLLVTRAKTKNGEGKWEAKMPENFESWDIDRIFTISRGMMIMEERLISLAAESKYPGNIRKTEEKPEGEANSIRFASAFLQDVVQATSTYAHMITKWGITQEAMAAYLFKGEHNETIRGLFEGWDPKELTKAYHEFEKDPEKLFESLDKTYYLGRRNPNRAGDIYTWISWRGQNKPDVPSMMQDYLLSGQKRMRERWEKDHPGQEIPKDVLNEYEKWSGTGFRFEKLRGNLEKHSSEEEHKIEDFNKAFKDAKQLIGRMVDLQPHRIYTVSRWVRERVDKNLTVEQKATISQDIENLAIVESAFLNSREYLLDKGIGFDKVDLNAKVWRDKDGREVDAYELAIADIKDKDGNIITAKEDQIARAKALAEAIRDDFANEGKKSNPKDNNYWKEFVYKRENTHGYVLWSGDTPGDEYNFAALGATGGFVRRARDNANQAKATEAEIAMLGNLVNIHHPDQLYEAMLGIYQHIDHYDRSKAKQAMAEKAEGLIKFYKASYKTKIPIYGVLRARGSNKASYARSEYGSHQAAWESSDIRYFIEKLEHAQIITEEDAHKLMKYAGATKKHIAYETSVGILQLFTAAMLIIGAETIVKESGKNIEV